MIKIEKIRPIVPTRMLPYTEQLIPIQPGLVDIFNSNPDTYLSWYYKDFPFKLPDNIQIGKLKGIGLQELLIKEPDDTYYEIDQESFYQMPRRMLKELVTKHKIIIYDLMEGGTYYDPVRLRERLKNIQPLDMILFHSGSFYVRLEDPKWRQIYAPFYALFTYNVNRSKAKFKYNPKKLALVPCRRPRDSRVKLLARLHEKDLLKECDWSLTFVTSPGTEYGDFFKSPNVNAQRFSFMLDTDEQYIKNFYNAHKDQLPKSFEDMPNVHFSDTSLISPKWYGNYKFNIVTETFDTPGNHFFTEKTFKPMMLGLPFVIYSGANCEKYLSRYGFRTFEAEYDKLGYGERTDAIIDFIQQDHNMSELEEIAHYNFNLMKDENFLLDIIVKKIALIRQ